MRQITLYTGGGASISPFDGEDRHVSDYVRLIADDNMGITDGNIITECIDTMHPELWHDCPLPEEDIPAEEALNIILGGTSYESDNA